LISGLDFLLCSRHLPSRWICPQPAVKRLSIDVYKENKNELLQIISHMIRIKAKALILDQTEPTSADIGNESS